MFESYVLDYWQPNKSTGQNMQAVHLMKKNISRPRSSALALTLLFVLGSCDSEPEAPPEVVARPIKMFVVGGAGAEVTLQFSGVVAPAQDATLAFEVPGRD